MVQDINYTRKQTITHIYTHRDGEQEGGRP
jgi:hypothetical protein